MTIGELEASEVRVYATDVAIRLLTAAGFSPEELGDLYRLHREAVSERDIFACRLRGEHDQS